MKIVRNTSLLIAAALLCGQAIGAELETDAQKLGYIIGMDIGKSLKQQQTEIDLDHLFEAIGAAYRGEDLAITDEEANTIREGFIAERRAAVEAEREAAAGAIIAAGLPEGSALRLLD